MKRLLPLRNNLSFVSFAADSTTFRTRQLRRLPTFLPRPIHSLYSRGGDLYEGQLRCRRFGTNLRLHAKEHIDSWKQANLATMNGPGPTTRSKRKHAPPPIAERPSKQFRQSNGKVSPSENTPDEEMAAYVDIPDLNDEDLVPFYQAQAQPGDSAEWQAMVQNVVRNVVSIRFCQTCSFDTDAAFASEATGFVVDAEKGLVAICIARRVEENE